MDPMSASNHRPYRLINVVIALVIFSAGLILAIASISLSEAENNLLKSILENTSSTLIVGGALGLAFEFFIRKDLIDIFRKSVEDITSHHSSLESNVLSHVEIVINKIDSHAVDVSNRLSISNGVSILGISEIHAHENNLSYSDIIKFSKELFFVFNDGRTWFSTHEADLSDRLADGDKRTTVILNDRKSTFLSVLAKKVDQDAAALSSKIDESIYKLSKLSSKNHVLEIYGHNVPSSYSLIMNEEKAILIPYLMARKADRIPCFVFARGVTNGFYETIRKDVFALMNNYSEKVYPQELPLRKLSE